MNLNIKKLLIIAIIIIAIIVITGFIKNSSENQKNEKTLKDGKKETEQLNYFESEDGNKVNTSSGVDDTKLVGDLSIEKSKIAKENDVLTLTAKVINRGTAKTNVKLKVMFIDENSNVITEIVTLVGDLKENATGDINASLSTDVSNSSSIIYEIID